VKGAESKIVDPSFFQLHKTANDFGNINPTEDLLYRLLGNQIVKVFGSNLH
jgi:hypothetical protein